MNITRVGAQPSAKGPAEWFSGTVRIDPLFQPQAPARAIGASVTFARLMASTSTSTASTG